jgi:copper homeostasis protein
MSRVLLEVCVDSVCSARQAIAGGAARLEVCSALAQGGLSPTLGLVQAIRIVVDDFNQQRQCQPHQPAAAAAADLVRVYALIRPRAGDFLFDADEVDIMVRDIGHLCALVDGFVLGCLTREGEIDWVVLDRLVHATGSGSCSHSITFHRAIDMSCDPLAMVRELFTRQVRVNRVLTSGGCTMAFDGRHVIARMCEAVTQLQIEQPHRQLVIMAGGGINEDNVKQVVRDARVHEIHGSCRTMHASRMKYRNTKCSMSSTSTSSTCEYSQYVTDSARVARCLQLANQDE